MNFYENRIFLVTLSIFHSFHFLMFQLEAAEVESSNSKVVIGRNSIKNFYRKE